MLKYKVKMKNRIQSISVCSSDSRSTQNTNIPDIDGHDSKALFGPLLTMFKYSGTYIDKNQRHKGFMYYLHFGMCILFIFLITVDNGRMFMYIGMKGGSANPGKIMVFASIMFFNVFLNFLSVRNLVANSCYLNAFLTEFVKYDTQYGLAFDANKLKSKLRKRIAVSVVSMTVGVPVTLGFWVYLLNYWPETIMEVFVYPFNTW